MSNEAGTTKVVDINKTFFVTVAPNNNNLLSNTTWVKVISLLNVPIPPAKHFNGIGSKGEPGNTILLI